MKVSELQESLKKYDPDKQLIVAIWDKECFTESMNTEERLLTDKEWNYVAENFNTQLHDQMFGAGIRHELEAYQGVQNVITEKFIADFVADYEAEITDEQLWDIPATKTTGEQNVHA